jgi:hypothetical protein
MNMEEDKIHHFTLKGKKQGNLFFDGVENSFRKKFLKVKKRLRY